MTLLNRKEITKSLDNAVPEGARARRARFLIF
jgi:hypothetical protein